MSLWKRIHHQGQTLYDIGVHDDGTLKNPRGYPEDVVREAVQAAEQRRAEKRREAAGKAAVTRRRRREKKVLSVARTILERNGIGRRGNCAICNRTLSDEESINRGIGSECWQDVLATVEKLRSGGGQ
jgi:hypothetical protein